MKILVVVDMQNDFIDGVLGTPEAQSIVPRVKIKIDEALQNEYKEKLAVAQQTSDRMVKEAVARGQNRQDEIISQANAEARAILDKAAADIAQEKKKAINDAKNEISALAMAIAEKVVGRELNDVDQSKLVDEFIEELGD
jgi:F-type H+-transporting ATPase subunit b